VTPSGRITGYYDANNGQSHGFLKEDDRSVISFDVPGARDTFPQAINSSGEIVGVYGGFDLFFRHAFLRQPDGTISTFDVANSVQTYVTGHGAINSAGEITGYYYPTLINPMPHGFLRQADGEIVTFDVPGSTQTSPSAINNRGQITGLYIDDVFHLGGRGFLRDADGTIMVFDAPGATTIYTIPRDINAAGEIVGIFADSKGFHGFIRHPRKGPSQQR
jgi:hypothetical protein